MKVTEGNPMRNIYFKTTRKILEGFKPWQYIKKIECKGGGGVILVESKSP